MMAKIIVAIIKNFEIPLPFMADEKIYIPRPSGIQQGTNKIVIKTVSSKKIKKYYRPYNHLLSIIIIIYSKDNKL